MTKRSLTIATRESPLALQQAESIRKALLIHHPHLRVELLGITTAADEHLDVKLIDIGGKGLFVKELEEALYDGRADIAVHSMKDVPMDFPPGLGVPVITEREDPRDVFVSNQHASLNALSGGMVIGTASLRRQTQLKQLRGDVHVQMLRGNIHTRLKRLDEGKYDAIILAAAGLKRMGLSSRIAQYFAPEDMLPSAGQGALGIECRLDDETVKSIIAPLNHPHTFARVSAERAVCKRLGGGCKIPLAVYAEHHHDHLHLRAILSDANGKRVLKAEKRGPCNAPEQLGLDVALRLIADGAEAILASFYE